MNQKKAERSRPKGYYFLTAVWGKSYSRLFLEITIPSLLAPGNLPQFKGDPDSQFIIFTTMEDANIIRAASIFQQLSAIISINIEYILKPGADSRYDLMSDCHKRGLAMADAADAAVLFMSPDLVFADGSLRTVKRLAEEGKDLILVTGVRTIKQTIPQALQKYFVHNDSLVILPQDLMRIAMDNLHPLAHASWWEEGSDDNLIPANLYWRAGEEGILARCFHLHTILVYPQRKNALFFSTHDDDLSVAACPDAGRQHIITDSDNFLIIEMTDKERMFTVMECHKGSVKDVAVWAEFAVNDHHRQFLNAAIRMHTGIRDPQAWQEAERKSDETVAAIQKQLSRPTWQLLLSGQKAFIARAIRLSRCYELFEANAMFGQETAWPGIKRSLAQTKTMKKYAGTLARLPAKLFAIYCRRPRRASIMLQKMILYFQHYRGGIQYVMRKMAVLVRPISNKIRGTMNPRNRIPQMWRAGVMYNSQGRRKEAVNIWARMMEMQQDFARKLGALGEIRYFFGPLWVVGFGHIALLDYFAKCKELGLNKARLCIITTPDIITNKVYLKYWNPWFEVVHDRQLIRQYRKRQNLYFPAIFGMDGKWLWMHEALAVVEERWEASGRGPLLKLSPEHTADGWRYLTQKGVPRNAWFVTLHVREGGTVSGNIADTRGIRNADIASYLKTIERITNAGGWVIRIGSSDFTPLPEMPQLIDYAASKDKSDGLDVFFLSECRFAVATNSGPAWVAKTFGTPVLLTNWAPIGDLTHAKKTITLPQLLWSHAQGRYLRFEEQFQEPYGFLESAASLAKHGLKPLPNRSDEISQGVREIMAMIDSGWQTTPEDDMRQEKFKQIAKQANVPFRGRIGADFLARHADLLEILFLTH